MDIAERERDQEDEPIPPRRRARSVHTCATPRLHRDGYVDAPLRCARIRTRFVSVNFLLGLAVSAWWMRDWLYQPDGVCGIGMVGCNSLVVFFVCLFSFPLRSTIICNSCLWSSPVNPRGALTCRHLCFASGQGAGLIFPSQDEDTVRQRKRIR